MSPRFLRRACSPVAGAVLAAFAVLAAPLGDARAQGRAAGAASQIDRLSAEIARMRAELERKNDEVNALKRGGNRARLERRMAEADSLARRLTAAEAELRRARGDTAPAAAPALLAADPSPHGDEGPLAAEARADLMLDQARRLAAEADGLAQAATRLRARDDLRRRSRTFERDPFAGLDFASRRMAIGVRTADGQKRTGGSEGATAGDFTSTSGGGARVVGTTASDGAPAGSPAAEATSAPPAGGTVAPAQATSAVTMQMKALLDPQTLAEVRRLEGAGDARASAEALEKAAAALRARAAKLEADSRALREAPPR